MNEVLKIEVQAQVAQAQAALRQLQTSLKGTEQAAKGTTQQMPKLGQSTNQATFALTNLGRVASDAPFGLIGIANNIDPLIQSFVLLKKETGTVGGAFRALGASLAGGGGLILGISLLTSAAQFAALGFDRWSTSTKKAKEEQDKLVQAQQESVKQLSRQKEEVLALANIIQNSANAENVRVNALNRLNEIIPDTVGKLTLKNAAEKEGILVIKAYISALEAQATAELLIGRIAENNVKLFDNRQKALQQYAAFEQEINDLRIRQEKARAANQFELAESIGNQIKERIRLNDISQKGNNIFRQNADAILKENELLRQQYQNLIPRFDELFKKPKGNKEDTEELTKQTNVLSSILDIITFTNEQGRIKIENQKLLNQLLEQENKLRKTGEKPKELPSDRATPSLNVSADGTGFNNQLRALGNQTNDLNKQLELSDQLINSIAGEFADLFTNLSKDGVKAFEDIAKSIAQTTQRILIQYAVTQALKALLNSIAPGSGSISDLIGVQGGGTSNLDIRNLRILG
jgi:hypothetical protein